MTELIQLIQDADAASVQMEQARQAADAAKSALEAAKAAADEAKTNFEGVVARADELGVPRAKLRKLIEERSAVLMASGLMGQSAASPAARVAKPAKKRVKIEKQNLDEDIVQGEADEDVRPSIKGASSEAAEQLM